MSGGRVDAWTYGAPDDLADLVESLWVGAWDLRGQPPHHTELLADPSVNVVFEAGDARVVGVWTRLWRRTLAEKGRVRAAKLHPGAVTALLPGPAARYRDRIVPLAEVVEDAGALCHAVLGPDDDEAGCQALAAWLRGRARRTAEIALAVRLVAWMRGAGVTRVSDVAEHAGLSARETQRLFHDCVGAAPKGVLRRMRLQEVALRVEAGDAPDLATLALDLGYADQAHLARDFRAATGRTLRGFGDAVHR